MSWLRSSGGSASFHSLRILSGSVQESVWFPARERTIEGKFSLRITARNMDCNLHSIGTDGCDAQSGSHWNSLNSALGSTHDSIL